MKIIRLFHIPTASTVFQPEAGSASSLQPAKRTTPAAATMKTNVPDTSLPSYVVTIPDTALLLRKNPFFIPDFASCCTAQLCAAVRINRLGRSIHQRFASRYYDRNSVSLGVHFVAENLLQELRQASAPWDLAVGFDNAVAVPDAIAQPLVAHTVATFQLNDTSFEAVIPADFFQQTDECISRVSQFYTLRQGDLLLFPLPLDPQEVHIDDRITLLVDGAEHFAFHVK